MENIIDCGNYGYVENGDCFDIYEWNNGWQETGFSFACSEAEAKEFCERYNGFNSGSLFAEIFGF